jgi:uncharacterized protein (DUF885 family)
MRPLFLAALLALAPLPAAAAPADDFHKLLDEHWAWALRQNPVMATSLGVHDYDDRLADISLAADDARAKDEAGFLARLKAIPAEALSPGDRINRDILARMLAEDVEANGFGQRMILFTTYAGFHQDFAGLAEQIALRTKADHENYLKRLAAYPALNDEAIRITAQAVAKGYAQPCDAMKGFEKTISGVIAPDPTRSRFYAPFLKARPIDMSDAEWAAMQQRARDIITGTLNPAYQKFYDYYVRDYAPKCQRSPSVAAQPDGARYYAFQIRHQTTTTLSADEIHKIGLAEVARIRAEMEALARKSGYADAHAFIAKLRTDPAFYPKTADELLRAAAYEDKLVDGMLPGYFGRLPRLPYGIKPIHAETAEGTTTAYYMPGSPETGIAGFFAVNTSKLDQRPFWEIPALAAHESVPGHHLQIALQQELDLPPFRKYLTGFTAYVEGWALYSEHLGIEMGIYDTPEKDMGRLSYEMWRACRLVVDTGIHSKGWSKAQAIAFITDNSALSAANIEAEVNRYIAWPGQALGYKLGELRIRALRARAEKALGPKFDLRRFHDVVLAQGAVPLDVLEAQVDAWLARERG